MSHHKIHEWDGYTDGDLVRVKGQIGNYIFKYAAVDELGNCLWVSVYGPNGSQYRQWRSFSSDRILPLTAKKRKVSTTKHHARKVANQKQPVKQADVRKWAQENGIEVAPMGNIKLALIEKYRKFLDSQSGGE